jgi:hypothetical protein
MEMMMTTAKHTLGPWETKFLADYNTSGNTIAVVTRDKFPTAFVPAWDDNTETAGEALANARLIAAAPDMLSALEQALETMSWVDGENDCSKAMRMVEAAIAKATASPTGEAV